MPDEKIAILGSPRYNNAWLKVLEELTPQYDFGPHDALNLVLFLRSPQYPIFWQEVVRTIRMVTATGNQACREASHPPQRRRSASPVL